MGVFNDTLMAELLVELGQLRDMDIVLVNWGAWYPRFTWGYSEVISEQASCTGAACTVPWLARPGSPCYLTEDTAYTYHVMHSVGNERLVPDDDHLMRYPQPSLQSTP